MNRFLITCLLPIIFGSCNPSKRILQERAATDEFCLETLKALSKRLKKKPEGIFYFKMNARQENFSALNKEYEKIINDVFIELNTYHTDCFARFLEEDIVSIFGQPTRKASMPIKVKSLQYVLDTGPECPCKACPERDKYSDCWYFDFIFNEEGKLIRIGGAF